MKEVEFDKPEVKQAIEDLAEGKKTKAVEEFLKKYEITPKNQTEQSINNQNSEEMAKKNQTQQPVVEANDQQQNNQYRYNESMINRDQLKNFGLSREYLQERGLLDSMLKGYKTNQLVPINLNFGSAVLRTDARLSLQQSNTGEVPALILYARLKKILSDSNNFIILLSDKKFISLSFAVNRSCSSQGQCEALIATTMASAVFAKPAKHLSI